MLKKSDVIEEQYFKSNVLKEISPKIMNRIVLKKYFKTSHVCWKKSQQKSLFHMPKAIIVSIIHSEACIEKYSIGGP